MWTTQPPHVSAGPTGSHADAGGPCCPQQVQASGLTATQRPRTSRLAAGALITGILAFVTVPVALHLVAISLGDMARADLQKDPTLRGGNLATVAIVLGYIGLALTVVALLVLAWLTPRLFAMEA